MAIQQSINQLLYSANIGAGFYSQTPEAKGRYEAKAAEAKGQKKASSISSHIDEFMAAKGKAKKDIWTKEDFTPEEFAELKKLHKEKQTAAYRAWNADPTEERWKAYHEAAETNKSIRDLGNEWYPKPKKSKGQAKAIEAGADALETSTATKAHMANVRKEEANNG